MNEAVEIIKTLTRIVCDLLNTLINDYGDRLKHESGSVMLRIGPALEKANRYIQKNDVPLTGDSDHEHDDRIL